MFFEKENISYNYFSDCSSFRSHCLGAHLFVGAIGYLATLFGIPAFVLAIIIAPIATELPEKFNSIIWVRQGKDTLALGNITGAMVFQSSLIPALGIALTPWELNPLALISAVLALTSAGIVYLTL
ncbi:MAG: inner membrane protein, partial [bacterium]